MVVEIEIDVQFAFAARCDLHSEIAIAHGDRRSIISRSRADGRDMEATVRRHGARPERGARGLDEQRVSRPRSVRETLTRTDLRSCSIAISTDTGVRPRCTGSPRPGTRSIRRRTLPNQTFSERATMNVTTVDEIESVVHIAFAARCDLRFEIAIAHRGSEIDHLSKPRGRSHLEASVRQHGARHDRGAHGLAEQRPGRINGRPGLSRA